VEIRIGWSVTVVLPERTSDYNIGVLNDRQVTGRYKDANGKNIKFDLIEEEEAAVRDGTGQELARVRKAVMLNRGAVKEMDVDGDGDGIPYVFGWSMNTDHGKLSGWIPRNKLKRPPDPAKILSLNPRAPHEGAPLEIDCERATEALADLRFKDRTGKFRPSGNWGDDYAGRNPGPLDFVNLCFNVPNVIGGGVAKDSIPNGELFVPGLDEDRAPIRERMTMYRSPGLREEVCVHFVYGRTEGEMFRPPRGEVRWGWIAQANVGHIPAPAGAQAVLRHGDRGEAVKELQKLLGGMAAGAPGLDPGTPDGDFGNRTESAVRAFQQRAGLKVDGVVGVATWEALCR
jgi:hypothetical protein